MRGSWLLVAVCLAGAAGAGCGDDDAVVAVPDASPFADASPFDGALEPDARPVFGPITVKVYDQDGLPRPATAVVVERFDQIEVTTSTGADGTAHPMVNTGDTVTALYEYTTKGTERRVVTWNGVEPGDVLTMGSPAPNATSLGTITVSAPGPVDGATLYRVSSGCEVGSLETPGPFSYDLAAGCHADPAHVPVLLEALDAQGHLLAYAGGESALSARSASASFDAWRTDPIAFASALAHLPADAPVVNRHLALLARGGELFELPLEGGAASATGLVPQGVAPAWIYAQELAAADGLSSRWSVVAGAAPIPHAVDLDAATGLLGRVTGLSVDASFPANPQVFWSLDATTGSTLSDASVITLEMNESGAREVWIIVSPGGTNQTHLPALPDSQGTFRPTQAPRAVTVVAIESNNADYAQLRAVLNGFATDGSLLWSVVTAPLRSGTARLSEQTIELP